MDRVVECMRERRIGDDSRIFARGALEMELPLAEVGRLWGGARLGKTTGVRALLNMPSLRSFLAIQMEM